jgi:hypothetical protein
MEQSSCAFKLKEIAQNYNKHHPVTMQQREAIDMIMVKLSRILCGDPNHKDHWDDIAGYAMLVSRDLK